MISQHPLPTGVHATAKIFASAAAKIRTSDVHYLTLLPSAVDAQGQGLDSSMNLDRSLVADLSTTSRGGGGGGGRVLRTRHSVAGGHGANQTGSSTSGGGANEAASGMMQRLRALNAGARLNTLEQCSTPLATQGKGYVSIGMKRHSMSARLNRSQDKRARPSLAPGMMLGSTTTAPPQSQPQQSSSTVVGSTAVVVSGKASGQGLVSASGSGPFSALPTVPTSSQSQEQPSTLVGPFTTTTNATASMPSSTSATTSANGKVTLPELFATVALDTPFYQAQSSSAVVTALDHVLNSEEFTSRPEVQSTYPVITPTNTPYPHSPFNTPYRHITI